MARQNKPHWGRLYLIGAAGTLGLIAEWTAKVSQQVHSLLLIGWVVLVFALIGGWINDNSAALSALDEDGTPRKAVVQHSTRASRTISDSTDFDYPVSRAGDADDPIEKEILR